MKKYTNPVKAAIKIEQKIFNEIVRERNTALQRFPLLFTLLTAFGLVATFYGFEHLLDQIEWLANNGWAMLAVGIGTLVGTGALYKKLG